MLNVAFMTLPAAKIVRSRPRADRMACYSRGTQRQGVHPLTPHYAVPSSGACSLTVCSTCLLQCILLGIEWGTKARLGVAGMFGLCI